MEQDTFWWLYAEVVEHFGVPKGKLDHLPYTLYLLSKPTDVLVGHTPAFPVLNCFLLYGDLRRAGDDDRFFLRL